MNEGYRDKIDNWKKQYGKVFITKIDGEEFIYRLLSVGEASKVVEIIKTDEEQAENIALKAVLYPLDFNVDNYSNGSADILIKNIIESATIFDQSKFSKLI